MLGEARTLYPDMVETLRATEILANEGFKPMVYCVDDPIAAKRLEDVGAVAIMPLGAPIGSGLGIQNRVTIRLIVEGAKVPVLVDAGVGTASDAAVAMELGCDGVLMNTAIAEAKDPILMARAMKAAVEAGRLSYRAGRMGIRRYADPSSPLAGLDLRQARRKPDGTVMVSRRFSLATRHNAVPSQEISDERVHRQGQRRRQRSRRQGEAGDRRHGPTMPRMQAEGAAQEGKGHVQQGVGNAKGAVKGVVDKL